VDGEGSVWMGRGTVDCRVLPTLLSPAGLVLDLLPSLKSEFEEEPSLRVAELDRR